MANAAKMPVNHQFPVAPAKRAPIPVLPNATRRIGPAQQSKGTNKGTNNIPKKAQTPSGYLSSDSHPSFSPLFLKKFYSLVKVHTWPIA